MSFLAALHELPLAELMARWTALLVIAWVAHRLLAGRNPRWRVMLWRAGMVGVVGVGLLALVPPVVTVPVVPAHVWGDVQADRPLVREQPTGPVNLSVPNAVVEAAEPVPLRVRPPVLTWKVVTDSLIALWAVGAMLFAVRLALAWLSLARVIGRATEPPACVNEICREVALAIAGSHVRVVSSSEMHTPCLAGLRRPVLLLPAGLVADEDLRGVLAHELAHAKGNDLTWNLVAHLVTVLLWFHPLVWRLRSVHAAACDAVSDAVAANYLGDVDSYARTLARMALAVLAPPPKTGLAMARSCEVRGRVDALKRRVFESALPRRMLLPALVTAFVLLLAIGGMAFTAARPVLEDKPVAGPANTGKAEEALADGRLELQILDQTTGRPLEGVGVTWQLQINGGSYSTTKDTTPADGRAILKWARGATVNELVISVRKPGMVPYRISWKDTVHPARVPAAKIIRLARGTTVGGVVTDEAGGPVAGAKIFLSGPINELGAATYYSDMSETATDSHGRWRLDDAPEDLAALSLSVTARGFLGGRGTPSRDLDSVIILRRGFRVTGRVMNAVRKPIARAKVTLGNAWTSDPNPTTTDEHGAFSLEGCPPGASVVTVMADGFAPDLREVRPEDSPSLEFRLEPGQTVRGRVIDSSGLPIAGLTIRADGWRGHRSLGSLIQTDDDGQFEWRAAPRDAVTYFLYKPGHMQKQGLKLLAGESPHTITIDPELVISGKVTEASTGKALPAFRVVRGWVYEGNTSVEWSIGERAEFVRGRYTVKYSDSGAGYALRIEAPGYKPLESRVFKPNEGSVRFDCALERARLEDLVRGTIVDPDGQPAPDVEVAMSTPGHRLTFEPTAYRFSQNAGLIVTRTDGDGRFLFSRPNGAYVIAAMSERGYLEMVPEQLAKADSFTLVEWGKIEGEARIANRAAANVTISLAYRNLRRKDTTMESPDYLIRTRTDAHGRFAFNRVIPGANEVSRLISTDLGQGASLTCSYWQQPIFVEPGQALAVRVGGKGRAVVGRVVLEQPPGMHVDLRRNQPVTLTRAAALPGFPRPLADDPRTDDRFAGNLEQDGRFRVDDVPPGRYELTVSINGPPNIKEAALGKELARVVMPVVVPEGEDVEPIDLGVIVAAIKGR